MEDRTKQLKPMLGVTVLVVLMAAPSAMAHRGYFKKARKLLKRPPQQYFQAQFNLGSPRKNLDGQATTADGIVGLSHRAITREASITLSNDQGFERTFEPERDYHLKVYTHMRGGEEIFEACQAASREAMLVDSATFLLEADRVSKWRFLYTPRQVFKITARKLIRAKRKAFRRYIKEKRRYYRQLHRKLWRGHLGYKAKRALKMKFRRALLKLRKHRPLFRLTRAERRYVLHVALTKKIPKRHIRFNLDRNQVRCTLEGIPTTAEPNPTDGSTHEDGIGPNIGV